MDRFYCARDQLDATLRNKNWFTDALATVEDKTNVKRVYIVMVLVLVVPLYMIFGYGTSFIATLIGFVYPAYRSIKALETLDKDDDTKWLTYWVVYATVSVTEAFTDILFHWIPLYSVMKCALFLFMMIPTNPNGSMLLYKRVILPYFLKNEKKIDEVFNHTKDMAADFGNVAKKAGVDLVAQQMKDD